MRIRLSFAIAFLILLVFSSSFGLLPHSSLPSTPAAAQPYIPAQSDKALHFVAFFALTVTFYFILDTSRRRVLHLTLLICTLVLGVGSEVLQGLLPNDRDFDPWDVLANVLGSLVAVGLAGAYHRRAAERRRRAKYSALSGLAGVEDGDEDLELGEAPSSSGLNGDQSGQETGIVAATAVAAPTTTAAPPPQSTTIMPPKSVEEEVDNWDENAEDDVWEDGDDDDATSGPGTRVTPATSSAGSVDLPKKVAVD